MKKLFFFVAFFGLVAFSANAQTCSKTAKADKACCASKSAAVKLASMDDSIEASTCATSGKVTYHKKNVCPTSGKVTTNEVYYCTKDKKFVNVSPSKKAAAAGGMNVKKTATAKKVSTTTKKSCDPAACSKGAKACSKTASAKKVSATTKKSCDPKNCDPAQCKKGAKVSNAKLVKATAEKN